MSTYVEQPDSFNLQGIQVDVDGLAAFRTMLHLELTQNLQPGAQRIINDQRLGYGFGLTSASAAVNYAQGRYIDALDTSTRNLATYLQVARALIDGINDVIEKYENSDLSSGDLIQALNDRLTAARTAASAPDPYIAAL